nr:TetR/AcrR family transcriptional regulator [Brevibacterium yomogidense]
MRKRIIDAAAVLFAEHGFERTTTAMICEAAGTSPGGLYHHFTGKKQLFIAVLTDDRDETGEKLESLRDSDRPLEALILFVEHLAHPATEHPLVSQLVLEAMLQAHRDEDVRTTLEEVDDEERAGIEELLTRAIEGGEIGTDLDAKAGAQWIMNLIGAVYLGTMDGGVSAEPMKQLRRTLRGYLQYQQ